MKNECWIKIVSCKDAKLSYADRVGDVVYSWKVWPESGYVYRDSDGYSNWVAFEDAEVVSEGQR